MADFPHVFENVKDHPVIVRDIERNGVYDVITRFRKYFYGAKLDRMSLQEAIDSAQKELDGIELKRSTKCQ